MLAKYENLVVNGRIVSMVGLGGSRKRSIVEAILDLKTLVKVVGLRAEGLEEVME